MMKNQQTPHSASDLSRRTAIKHIGLGMASSALTTPLVGGDNNQLHQLVPTVKLTDPIYYSSTAALARAIREKQVSCEEVTTAFLERVNQVNPKLNAVVQLVVEQALEEAKEADITLERGDFIGPLHGVPMTMKDSFDTAGIIGTAGTLGRKDFIPEKDATIVARLKQAGAILLGKTNTPELTPIQNFEKISTYGRPTYGGQVLQQSCSNLLADTKL